MSTIPELFSRAADRYPGRTAVSDSRGRVLSFAQVRSRARALAAGLQDIDPEPVSRVAVISGNRAELVEIDFGIAVAGKVRAPLNPKLSRAERIAFLRNCGAAILIAEPSEAAFAAELQRELPRQLRAIILLGAVGQLGVLDYAELLSADWPEPEPAGTNAASPSLIMHTSGTTGEPKGSVLSDGARVAAATHMLLHEFAPDGDDGMIHAAPMSHGSGSKVVPFFIRGARSVPLERFDAAQFWRAVRDLGGTASFLVPTMIRMLLDGPPPEPATVARLRNITYGGAPSSPQLLAEAVQRFGYVFTGVYGSCEALHPVTVLTRADHVELLPPGGPLPAELPVGTPAMAAKLRIDGGQAEGELIVTGPNVMSGYWNNPAATAEVLVDGWYRTGDVASADERGFIYLHGRTKDMIISGGLNVYPAEVEAALERHEDVAECCVIGLPDAYWGEAVTAVIVPADGNVPSLAELREHCARYLADYKRPRAVLLAASLPRGPTGKVLKHEVRDWAQRPGPEGNG
jgi:acyl-CoA synthetase (AMP-forming)/AMP-acid ligase II